MRDRPLQDQAGGARTLASAVPVNEREPGTGLGLNSNAAPPDVVTDERCSICAWPEVCEADRTCWEANKANRREHRPPAATAQKSAPQWGGHRSVQIADDADPEISDNGITPGDEPDGKAEESTFPRGNDAPDGWPRCELLDHCTLQMGHFGSCDIPAAEDEPPATVPDRAEAVPDRPARATKWNADTIVAAFKAFHAEHGRAPRQLELKAPLPSPSNVHKLCGGIVKACELAGIPATRHHGPVSEWTKPMMLDAGMRWHRDHHKLPTADVWHRTVHDGFPSYSTVVRQFGSWKAYLAELQGLLDAADVEDDAGAAAEVPATPETAEPSLEGANGSDGAPPEGNDGATAAAPASRPEPRFVRNQPSTMVELASTLESLDQKIAELTNARRDVADQIRERLDR